eukprot:4693442-Pleurochrysis_carterae.AAC.1
MAYGQTNGKAYGTQGFLHGKRLDVIYTARKIVDAMMVHGVVDELQKLETWEGIRMGCGCERYPPVRPSYITILEHDER